MCSVPPLSREPSRAAAAALKLHGAPMTTRRHKPPASFRKPTNRLSPLLRYLELKCNCKLTMRPRCLVGKVPGCRVRRNTKRCDCEVALLPVCLVAEGIGCADRQLGKKCKCAQAMLPECFNLGCKDKKEGRNCGCERTPGDMFKCPHVCKKIMRYGKLTPEELASLLRWWVKKLQDEDYENYMDRPMPAPDVAVTQETRVSLKSNRLDMGVGLHHPQDILSVRFGREEEIVGRRQVDFLRMLCKKSKKGGSNGAA